MQTRFAVYKKEGINRPAVKGFELEPLVQVGAAGGISGFPCGLAQQCHG